jgi:hypothetical protein
VDLVEIDDPADPRLADYVGLTDSVRRVKHEPEAGFFLAYRSGWAVGTTSLISTVVCSTLLALLGVLAYGESFTVARVGGVALASVGAFFIVRG